MTGAVEGGRKVERNGWPTFSFSERQEVKDDGRDRVLQLHLCQGDFSSLSTELCRGRAAAGGWDWNPQKGKKAGKCLLTS